MSQKSLAKKALEAKTVEKQLKAVAKLKDQLLLAEIAKKSTTEAVREAALEKLPKQPISTPVLPTLQPTPEPHVSETHVLFSQESPAPSFDNAPLPASENKIISLPADDQVETKLKEQEFDGLIPADQTSAEENRAKIVSEFIDTDRGIYRDAKIADFEKITDEETLAEIAIQTNDSYIGKTAIEKLNDEQLIIKVAKTPTKNDNKYMFYVRDAAVKRVTDQDSLFDIAKNDKVTRIRMLAAQKLNDNNLAQTVYSDIAQHDTDDQERINAANLLTDEKLAQKVYAKIAKADKTYDSIGYGVCMQAIKNLIDQEALAYVSEKARYSDHRDAARAKIIDKSALKEDPIKELGMYDLYKYMQEHEHESIFLQAGHRLALMLSDCVYSEVDFINEVLLHYSGADAVARLNMMRSQMRPDDYILLLDSAFKTYYAKNN